MFAYPFHRSYPVHKIPALNITHPRVTTTVPVAPTANADQVRVPKEIICLFPVSVTKYKPEARIDLNEPLAKI